MKRQLDKEKDNIEREKYKRKKHLEEINEVYNELKKANKRIHSLDDQKLF